MLPSHLTCDVECFVSNDMIHDPSYVCLSLIRLYEKRCEANTLPKRVIIWSDGVLYIIMHVLT